jgi:Peptidase family S41
LKSRRRVNFSDIRHLMDNQPEHRGKMKSIVLAISLALLSSVTNSFVARAQVAADSITGRYEGVAKSKLQGDIPVVLQIKSDGERLIGVVNTPFGDFPIEGSYSKGQITIAFAAGDAKGTMALAVKTDSLSGTWSLSDDGGEINLKKTSADVVLTDSSRIPPAPTSVPHLTSEQWREDLHYLATELPKRHKNAFHQITREEFEKAVGELDRQIPTLQDYEIEIGLVRIGSLIGDGHTYVDAWRTYHFFPLDVNWFGDQLRVTRAAPQYSRALGTRVIGVEGKPLTQVKAMLNQLIPQGETEGYALNASAFFILSAEALSALRITNSLAAARWTFADDKGKRFTLDIKPVGQRYRDIKMLSVVTNLPLYLQRPDEEFWYTYLADSQTVFLNFKAYPESFKAAVEELMHFIDQHPTKRLVIDMRQNGGGDFTKVRAFLIPALKQRPTLNQRGHLFVVTGRDTFSAAMTNVVDLRKETKAIVVGEATGGRPNGYQEKRELILPNSGLRVSYSAEYYKFQEKDTPGVMPDKRIDPNWAAYKAGRDPVMEWILSYRAHR